MRALVIAALLATGCNLVIDHGRHARPDEVDGRALCTRDEDCLDAWFCQPEGSGPSYCNPCWTAQQAFSQNDLLPADGEPPGFATAHDGRLFGAQVAYTAWETGDGAAQLAVIRMTFEDRVPAPRFEEPSSLNDLLGMRTVTHVAMTLAPETETATDALAPVLAVLGTVGSAPSEMPALWVGHLPLPAAPPVYPADFIPLAPGADVFGPIALTPDFAGPPGATEPRVHVVWRERGAPEDPIQLSGYQLTSELSWTASEDLAADPGDFFITGAGGPAIVYGRVTGDRIGAFDPGSPAPMRIETPGRTAPAVIARVRPDEDEPRERAFAIAWPSGGPYVQVSELVCDGGCSSSGVEMRIHREERVGPIAMSPSPIAPLLFIEHTTTREEGEEVDLGVLALRREDGYWPGRIEGAGADARLGPPHTAFHLHSLVASIPTLPQTEWWAGSVTSYNRAGQVLETRIMRGCGGPETLTSGL